MNALVTYLHQGGFMMYPLIICSIIAIGIILERAWTFRKATAIDPEELLDEVRDAYRKEDSGAAAVQLLEQAHTPFARIFIRGIKNADRQPEAIDMAMSQEASNEVPLLENYLLG